MSTLEPVSDVSAPPSRGIPLRDRSVTGSHHTVPRHCWVTGPADSPGPWPGLVLDRRRNAGMWEGLVVYAVTAAGDVTLVQQWVRGDLIKLT